MKKTLTITAVIAFGAVNQAGAADFPVKAAGVLPIVYAWTGFYIGLNAGYGWGRDPVVETGDNVSGPPSGQQAINAGVIPSSLAGKSSGFVGGGQVGYNRQINQMVIGFEADWQWANIKASQTVPTNLSPAFLPFTTSASESLNSFGTLRGRLGFTPVDPVLVYVTGGFAFGRAGVAATIINPGCVGFCMAGSTFNIRSGWTAGGGLEWKLAPNWSVKTEYLYYDLGNVSQQLGDPRFPGAFITQSVNFKGNIVRAGVNYWFN
jgi:outer membrane immunogenic protein